MPGLENTHLKVFWKKSLKVCLGGGSVSCSTTSNFGFAVSLDKLMSQKVSLCKLHFLPSNWLPSTYPVATPKPALWGHQASMKECFAIANRVLLFAKLIFRQWKGAATGQPDPMPAWQRVQAGPGREAVVCQSKHWRETPTSQLPWVQPAHPIWRHPLCKPLKALNYRFSCMLPEPTALLALPKLVNILSTYQRRMQDKTKASPSICFSQGFHTSLQSLLVSSQPSVHEVLTNYLTVLPLRHAVIFASAFVAFDISCPIASYHQSFLELRQAFSLFLSLSFAPASFSLQFLPENCSSVLSPALSPLFLLYFLSWQLCLVLWPTSLPHPFSSAIRPCPVYWWCL